MFKETYHPNAYLARIRNVKLGLKARTRILNTLEGHPLDTRTIMKEAGMHYGVVMHHLKLLEAEGIVERKGNKPRVWGLTGLGQKRLENLG
ncbi:MAG: winged helix-turn-helix domain-containing protein [Candidatus Bathyarchaeota archaeon]|nr:winged helix-turn-helix domain-containing protein [Candidatus Bathyarchaeota archaeon]